MKFYHMWNAPRLEVGDIVTPMSDEPEPGSCFPGLQDGQQYWVVGIVEKELNPGEPDSAIYLHYQIAESPKGKPILECYADVFDDYMGVYPRVAIEVNGTVYGQLPGATRLARSYEDEENKHG